MIAVIGSLIAYFQWNTNRKRLKHELFDRRYKQFEVIRDFLGSIMTCGKVTQEAEREYLIGTRGIRFIFDAEISEYVDKTIWHMAVHLQSLEAELEGVPVGEIRSKNVKEQSHIKKKLHEEIKGLEAKFSKYLQLGH
tara:strand:+ start:4085 stop:4495 length:411 start_codon:yes stop_codon:yes gene_type:complete